MYSYFPHLLLNLGRTVLQGIIIIISQLWSWLLYCTLLSFLPSFLLQHFIKNILFISSARGLFNCHCQILWILMAYYNRYILVKSIDSTNSMCSSVHMFLSTHSDPLLTLHHVHPHPHHPHPPSDLVTTIEFHNVYHISIRFYLRIPCLTSSNPSLPPPPVHIKYLYSPIISNNTHGFTVYILIHPPATLQFSIYLNKSLVLST